MQQISLVIPHLDLQVVTIPLVTVLVPAETVMRPNLQKFWQNVSITSKTKHAEVSIVQ